MATKRKFLVKLAVFVGSLLLLFFILFLLRYPLMRAAGNFLIKEDPVSHCEVMFVLSGNSWDRGKEAARLMEQNAADQVICTGVEINFALQTMGIHLNNADLTRKIMLDHGADSSRIATLPLGTSTWEEYEAILAYCQERNLQKVMVLSSKFHTRRIYRVFQPAFEDAGIELLIRGASESGFEEDRWWESEAGLIFLNNEYVKLLYYAVKYR